ncbi:MAG TPA: thioredoxin family protein [Xanthomonadales bacterium]|nr:thioredoxin family protein [Xanthomonadales bacterium]
MKQKAMVSRDEWTQARLDLLAKEKAMSKALDELARKRRALPWVPVDKDYEFRGPNGSVTLTGLFGGCRQLIVYHFMYGPDWEQGCPSCSFWADNYNGIDVHLAHRDTALVAVSNTAIENIESYRQRMGWDFTWVSSLGNGFNEDFHVTFKPEDLEAGEVYYNFDQRAFPSTEAPGLSVFVKTDGGGVAHSYSCYGRGLDIFNGAYQLLDMTPKGRDEDQLLYSMAWLRRHDQYGD